MSASGLDVFDKTLQTTHVWLKDIMDATGPDRQVAWHVLGAVLRAVRDRIPLDLAVHLGAELPILVRGTYYDQWRPELQPERYRSLDEFLERVSAGLGGIRPVDPRDAARSVFDVLTRHLPEGQVGKVRDALPADVRALWHEAASAPGRHEVELDRDREHSTRRA
jgi:uncharacterized protein (DUF2267 family)